MKLADLVEFARGPKWAVEASVAADGSPQAAVIGVAVTDRLEIVFDTLGTTRKAQNLRENPRVALVIGWDDAQTLQIQGVAREPAGAELDAAKQVYFARFPDGREREAWPGITWFVVRPTWARYSDFRGAEPVVVTFDAATLAA
jgi:pyridoxine/pyridoxamine 5'-phosphate oxidase